MNKHIDLTHFSEEELVALNHRIVERLKSLHQKRCSKVMEKFGLGDLVSFKSSDGRIIAGTVARLNQKTITIVTSEGSRWNVSPGFLSKTLSGGAQSSQSCLDGNEPNVIPIGRSGEI